MFSCQTGGESPKTEVVPPEPVPQAAETVPPVVEPEEPPAPETPSGEAGQTQQFQVSQEMFQETFEDIGALITSLNKIIQTKDYSTWLTHLTREYIDTYSDPDMLYELSQQPTLKRYNIRLRSLVDYFNYVVVPSRSEATLDDIVFINENHVQAIMIINGRRSILYSLERVNNNWKIGI